MDELREQILAFLQERADWTTRAPIGLYLGREGRWLTDEDNAALESLVTEGVIEKGDYVVNKRPSWNESIITVPMFRVRPPT
jgi:hypothetical protein